MAKTKSRKWGEEEEEEEEEGRRRPADVDCALALTDGSNYPEGCNNSHYTDKFTGGGAVITP